MPLRPQRNPTAGADNATRTHRPGHYIRGLRAARDRLRVASDLAMAGWPAPAGQLGGGRFAPPRGAGDRTARPASGDGSSLRAAQAAAAIELRGIGLSPRRLAVVSRLCPLAPAMVAKEIGAASDDQCHS